jgi:hypothetical protein
MVQELCPLIEKRRIGGFHTSKLVSFDQNSLKNLYSGFDHNT